MLYWKKQSEYFELFKDFQNQNISSEKFSFAFIYFIKTVLDEKEIIYKQLEEKIRKNFNIIRSIIYSL